MNDNVDIQSTYEIWLCSSTGVRLSLIDFPISFSFSRAFGSVGSCSMTIPVDNINELYLEADNILQIWRNGRIEFQGLIRGIDYYDLDNLEVVTLYVEDGLSILRSRIVAYKSGDAKTVYPSGAAHDLLKRVVRQNLGSQATDTTRDLSNYGIIVEPDFEPLYMESKFPWKNVLSLLNNIVNYYISVANANPAVDPSALVFFDMKPVQLDENSCGWIFIVRKGQLGSDRTVDKLYYPSSRVSISPEPTIFSKELGNLENPRLSYDYSKEITYAYAGGEGEGSKRRVQEYADSNRLAKSPWSRREIFVNYSNEENPNALIARAKYAVSEGKPKVLFTGNLKDTKDTKYGLHWNYGDKISAIYRNKTISAIISAIAISVENSGRETISARVESFL